jgi:hypothetical protein
MSNQPAAAIVRRPRWPWLILVLCLVWTALIRVPLVLNAEDHLDSDLAVDGLTLLDAIHGHWRWHYPGTPYIGILPLLSSYPQALAWGTNPITLVSGGTVIWLLVVASTFWLAARTYGLEVAGWSILPLAFSSLGTIWLSSRITGGHLLTLVWHALAFAGLHACLTKGGWPRATALGLWCGLGVYLDAMFVFTWAGLVPAAAFAWLVGARSRRAFGLAAVFGAALAVGISPREIGRRIDPYDAYPAQFELSTGPQALFGHARLLLLHCLPRLVAGTELNSIEQTGLVLYARFAGEARSLRASRLPANAPGRDEWLAIAVAAVFVAAVIAVARDSARARDPARRAVGCGVLGSALLIVAGFLVNRNIYNSDNYRYLIYLLTPWALGFGIMMNGLAQRGRVAVLAACFLSAILLEMMTAGVFLWYRNERLYVDQLGLPVRLPVAPWTELTLLESGPRGRAGSVVDFVVPPDVTHVFGGYWDVYKMAFLSGGRVTGVPWPIFPNRFPGWSRGLGPGQGELLVMQAGLESNGVMPTAARRAPARRPAGRTDWFLPFRTVWLREGRDPLELDRLRVVVP